MSGLPPHTWVRYIPGPNQGYVRTTQRQKWVDPAYAKYQAYKRMVRLLCNSAGIPGELRPDSCYRVEVTARWKKRQRIDGDNIVKAIMDSLWQNDRRVTQIVYSAVECAGEENVRVSIHESANRFKAFIGRTKRRNEPVYPVTGDCPNG